MRATEETDAGRVARQWKRKWAETPIESQLDSVSDYEHLRVFRERLPKDGRILENGCGLCRYVVALRAEGYDVVGVDFVHEALRRAAAASPDLPLVTGDGLALPFASNSFDAVVSVGVIEHFMEGPAALLREARRVLRDGGLLLVSVPHFNLSRRVGRALFGPIGCVKGTMGRSETLRKLLRRGPRKPRRVYSTPLLPGVHARYTENEFYEYHYTGRQLRAQLAQTGFVIERVLPLEHPLGFYFAMRHLPIPAVRRRVPGHQFTPGDRTLGRVLRILLPWTFNHFVMVVAHARKPTGT